MKDRQVELSIGGMDCGNCALGIERQLKRLGLADASVNFATARARFTLPLDQPLTTVIGTIEGLGYRVSSEAGAVLPVHRDGALARKFLFALVFTLPLFLHHLLGGLPLFHPLHNPWVQLGLCLPVFILGLLHFGRSALASLRAGLANMDVLIVIGITASFGYSLYGTLFNLGGNFLFYETTATITTIVLLGNLIESRSVRRMSGALEELARIRPATARRISLNAAGHEELTEIPAEAIAPGDILAVNLGDKVPADGEVVAGEGAVDESMITGESLPVGRGVGDPVVGGTLVQQGSLRIRATAVGEHTVLAGIIRLVAEAQTNKPAIQRLGDQVSAIFTPVVCAIALLTLLVSLFGLGLGTEEAILRSVAVLVIACPCAMGLATPTAVMVGIRRAARSGILLKGGNTLEEFANVSRVVFDKTGTLTTGEFRIERLEVLHGDEAAVRSALVGLEQHSSHPIARSIVRELRDVPPLPFTAIEERRGRGISGRAPDGSCFEVGSRQILPPGTVSADFDLVVLHDGELIAGLAISDELKPLAAETVARLRLLGLEPVLLSGDRQDRCAAVARATGIERVYAERSPEEKLTIIEALEQEGPTAFVGDGVNDAPALARARVGVSLSDATQAAIESARVILLTGNLESLVMALRLARGTLITIRQNLFWAFSYNIIAIPIAAAGHLSPLVAAFAMGFSDIMTIGNSLRLRTKRL